jgi:hypothetical protein
MQLHLELEGRKTRYRPFDTLRGKARWMLEKPALLEVRLFWYTEGKGTQDVTVVDRLAIEAALSGESPIEFTLPAAPYTYHGKLLSILWAVELVEPKSGNAAIARLDVSPWDGPLTQDPQLLAQDPREFSFMRTRKQGGTGAGA